jgi:hypothetical protein
MLRTATTLPATQRWLGWLHVVQGGTGLFAALVMLALAGAEAAKTPGSGAAELFASIALWLGIGVFVPSLTAGIGLLRARPWAVPLTAAVSAIELLLVPIGTLIGGISLWGVLRHRMVVVRPDVAMDPESVAAREHERTNRRLVLVMAAGVGSGLALVIATGFAISGDVPPPELTAVVWPAAIVFAAVLAYAAHRLVPRVREFFELRQLRAEARAAALLPPPVPTKSANCVHLQPIERAMLAAGVPLTRRGRHFCEARCRIDEVAFTRRYGGSGVAYELHAGFERSPLDPPQAQVVCCECNSLILVRHPDEAPAGTPVFPRSA